LVQQDVKDPQISASRRALLRRLILGIPGTACLSFLPRMARASEERSLSLYHTHTGERLSVVYYADGRYLSDSLRQLNFLLRDFRNDEMREIDLNLLDLLHDVSRRFGGSRTVEIISAYRSPETNAMLHRRSNGVARNSLHMQGKAMDVRIRGVDLSQFQKAALVLGRGGVGYYSRSNFIHLDTGRTRRW
jgi:uncharacterized protein YcbK (DUF882 family)